ncbi:MAG: HNH endonuclease [Planctomycetota bacterium]|jgi:hypothetical protein
MPETCIYCGSEARGVRKGEHIVPEALGCTKTIRCVCAACNNSLSAIDRVLVSESFLAILIHQELKDQGQDVWDYDPERDIATEARTLPGYESPKQWPQIVYDADAPLIYGDVEEIQRLGAVEYRQLLIEHMQAARKTVGKKSSRWNWGRVRSPPKRGRLPPRVYTPHMLAEVKERTSFICRYMDPDTPESVLRAIDGTDYDVPVASAEFLGVADPEAKLYFEPKAVLRALTKIGLNLLAWCCRGTSVDRASFGKAMAFVMDDTGSGPPPDKSGFVFASDIAPLECPEQSHKFRLTHNGDWRLDCAFFAGKAGAKVLFPGPCREEWRRVDIVAPLHSNTWHVESSPVLLPPLLARVSWDGADLKRLLPSIPVANAKSTVRTEKRRRRMR